MSVEQYGKIKSIRKTKTPLSKLGLRDLVEELKEWQKRTATINSNMNKYPAGSEARGGAAKLLENAVLRAAQVQAFLGAKAQELEAAGTANADEKKVIRDARSYNVDNIVSWVNAIESSRMPAATTDSRSFSISPAAMALVNPVLQRNPAYISSVSPVSAGVQREVQGPFLEGQRPGPVNVSPPPAGRASNAPRTTSTTTVPTSTTTTTVPAQTSATPATPAAPAAPAAPTSPAAPRGGGTGRGRSRRGTAVVDGRRVKVGGEQWKQIIQEEFGGLWDVYNENADVKAVIDKSVKEGWFNDETKLTAALQSTNWYRTTEQSARQYAIELSADPATMQDRINTKVDELRAGTTAAGITFDDGTLRRLATDSIKFGWSDVQTGNAIGSEAVALAQAGGAQGLANLRQGTTGMKLRATARRYAQKPSDADIDTWVADIMTGRKSETQWEDFVRNSARTQFRSLAPALDRGDDVDTATYAYRQQAAQVLGGVMDVTEIDWTQDKWNKALNFKDPQTNESRQMDIWEWNKYLRSLPEWQETDEAKQAYRNVAFSLAQGFGRMA